MKVISNMPTETGALLLVGKFGLVKLLGFGAALLGAFMMAAFRPPKTRKEMFTQGAVALGSSLLFGGSVVHILAGFDVFGIDMVKSPMADIIQFNAMVHGLIGAMAWGMFGGMAVFRDKFSTDPLGTIKDVKDL